MHLVTRKTTCLQTVQILTYLYVYDNNKGIPLPAEGSISQTPDLGQLLRLLSFYHTNTLFLPSIHPSIKKKPLKKKQTDVKISTIVIANQPESVEQFALCQFCESPLMRLMMMVTLSWNIKNSNRIQRENGELTQKD